MRRIILHLFIASLVATVFIGCIARPPAVKQIAPQVNPKFGEEFKIKSISGTEVTVSIVENAGKHYIRSRYHHGWKTELRDYAITNAVQFVSTTDRSINIWFPHTPEVKLVGAVYVINNHGEAVKADDITMVDLTW